jgi:hypothetical protein
LTVIFGSCANYAASPLFLELAAEMAFPVDEAIIGAVMSCAYNLVGALFLFAFFIPNIGIPHTFIRSQFSIFSIFLSLFFVHV